MPPRTVELTAGVARALLDSRMDGLVLHIDPATVTATVATELSVLLARVGGGGKWNRSLGIVSFPRDPTAELMSLRDDARAIVEPIPAPLWRTPDAVAARLAASLTASLAFPRDMYPEILEPSAGDGSIVVALRAAHPFALIDAVESNYHRYRQLLLATRAADDPALDVFHARIEDWDAALPRVQYDAVVMHPPLYEPTDSILWVRHVALAWAKTRPTGRLLALLPEVLVDHRDGKIAALRRRIEAAGGTITPEPDVVFSDRGRTVHTVLVDVPGIRP